MNISEMIRERAEKLSPTEEGILKYMIANEAQAREMSIRSLASSCFVSTATILRFVRKLGFSGYRQFQEKIQEMDPDHADEAAMSGMPGSHSQERYLKNLAETVKIMTEDKIDKFEQIMSRYPKIFILAEGFSAAAADYIYELLSTIGYDAEIPKTEYELRSAERRIKRQDVLLVLSYSGNDRELISQLEHIITISTPTIMSITRAGENVVQNMSDLNFRVFADEMQCGGGDITSRCGMIAIMEVLLYQLMSRKNKSPEGSQEDRQA